MEVTPAAAAPAAAPPAGGGSSEMTASGQASQTNMHINVTSSGDAKGAPASAANGKWTDSFDSDTKDYVTQKGFTDPKAVLESYRNLEKLRGVPQERLLKLPEPTAGADAPEWSDVFSKLGKPATPEGYGLNPKDPNNAGFTDWAKATFHKNNLTSAQGQELVKDFNAFNENQMKAENAAHTAAVQEQSTKLRQEWGAAYQQNVNRAMAAYRQLGIPDAAIDSLEKSIGHDGVMKLFADLGSKVGEPAFVNGDGPQNFGEGSILTPDQANARIKALKQDQSWASEYLKGSVKHRAEMTRLMKMANPTD